MKQISITNIKNISAVYFALLQCKYDFYSLDRDSGHVEAVERFLGAKEDFSYFSDVRQNSCEVYPYWPRAAMLETASFYVQSDSAHFINFDMLQKYILSAGNISASERDQSFWSWIDDFPKALNQVMSSDSFRVYLEWENEWIDQQNHARKSDLNYIESVVDMCANRYHSSVREIEVVLNPIKCVYSSDYHLVSNRFIFCSGTLQLESVIHEFLHHVVHPVVESHKEEILSQDIECLNIDRSYFLTGDNAGRLNAVEEYFVRMLTNAVLANNPPDDLEKLMNHAMREKGAHRMSRG